MIFKFFSNLSDSMINKHVIYQFLDMIVLCFLLKANTVKSIAYVNAFLLNNKFNMSQYAQAPM